MRIVVATLPDVNFSLGRDLALAKSSVLYGDETVLYSPTYLGTTPLLDFSNRPTLYQLLWLSILRRDPGFVVGEKLTTKERERRIKAAEQESRDLRSKALRWHELKSGDILTKEQTRELGRIEIEAKGMARSVQQVFSEEKDFVKRARELKKGETLGLIRIEEFNKRDEPSLYYDPQELVSSVTGALSAPDAYGALDERFTSPLRLPEVMVAKQRVARVGSEMFQRLPLFEQASFDELRDIKQELGPYLANFRRGLIDISRQIRSQPWDQEFPHDVELEIRSRLLPEVAALEDKVKSNSYLGHLIHRAAKEPLVLPASSALGLMLSTTVHASAIASQVASAIAGGALLAFEAHGEWKETKKKTEENLFFFYYKADKLLGGRKGRAPLLKDSATEGSRLE